MVSIPKPKAKGTEASSVLTRADAGIRHVANAGGVPIEEGIIELPDRAGEFECRRRNLS
jgi:hypothetical protein